MEVTKWLKPSISVSRIGDSASVQAATRVNAEQALYGAFEVKYIFYTILYFLHSSFFVRLGIPFLRPDPHVLKPTRTGPVKVGRRSALAARSVVSRPRLDGHEHGGLAGCGRDTGCERSSVGAAISTKHQSIPFSRRPIPAAPMLSSAVQSSARCLGHLPRPNSSSMPVRDFTATMRAA